MSSDVRQGKMPPRHIEVRGAVVVWGTLMWSLMKDIVRTMGVRTDVPFRDLSPREKETVYHGELKNITSTTSIRARWNRRKWISTITARSIPSRTPLPRSRTRRE